LLGFIENMNELGLVIVHQVSNIFDDRITSSELTLGKHSPTLKNIQIVLTYGLGIVL